MSVPAPSSTPRVKDVRRTSCARGGKQAERGPEGEQTMIKSSVVDTLESSKEPTVELAFFQCRLDGREIHELLLCFRDRDV